MDNFTVQVVHLIHFNYMAKNTCVSKILKQTHIIDMSSDSPDIQDQRLVTCKTAVIVLHPWVIGSYST